MRKLALIIVAIACFSMGSNAQKMFEKGTQLFKLGVGVNGLGTPIDVSYEKGVKEDFLGVDGLVLGIGAGIGYYGYKEDFVGLDANGLPEKYSWEYTNIIIGARALAHYQFIKKLDTYSGVILGYNKASLKYVGSGSMPSPSAGGIVFGGLIGARYELSESLGAYVEAGFGISNVSVGLAYKF
jgi:hypothetical protein